MVSANMDTGEFGQAVKQRRKQEKMSQQVLADKVGISRNYLSQIERGQATNLSWQLRQRLTEVLGLQEEEPSAASQENDYPPGLVEFAEKANLPPDDVAMLSKLQYRGQQPTTPEKWELLYNVIKVTIGS
ncbi:MAG: helix-turn-helix transcriptional regulator [Merismopedia sp. SIO2A8]|nr:helix-turn-helix transcriptional regulator [Merismopedia sp. SIO2A8]